MRGKLFARFHRALQLIGRPQGASMRDLTDEFGVDRTSIYRLLRTIEDLGFPLYDDKAPLEKSKRWKFTDSGVGKARGMGELRLSRSELIALFFIRGYSRLYRGTALEDDINAAFDKICISLSPQLAAQLKRVQSLFIPSVKFAKDYSGKEEIIDALVEAILQQRTCVIRYHSFSDDHVKQFSVDPLHFFEHSGGLYLFANATDFGDIRILAVERIDDVEIGDTHFVHPETFDPGKWMEESFTIFGDDPFETRIRFSADQAKYIKERTWAKEQKIVDHEDGSIVLEMATSGRWDVMRWVLGFGSQAEVLEPQDLREEILAELEHSRKRYSRQERQPKARAKRL
jgi:predicted DNA-binding transcriptional regulator YafY